MEARREIAKRMRAAATSNDDAASQGSAGGVAAAAAYSGAIVSAAVTEMDGEEMAMVAAAAEAEAGVVGSAETEENVQRILLAIDNFTRKVSEMLDLTSASSICIFLGCSFTCSQKLQDPQGEGGEVGGGDQGAARPRRRQRADPRRPPQRPAPALAHPPVAQSAPSHLICFS